MDYKFSKRAVMRFRSEEIEFSTLNNLPIENWMSKPIGPAKTPYQDFKRENGKWSTEIYA